MKQGPSCLFLQAAEVPRGLDWLGPAERQHLATLRWAKRRSDWLLGRWTAKQTVVRAPELRLDIQDLAELEVLPTPGGAPQTLLAGEPLPVAISLSHRAGAALCVVAKTGSLGCDLEWLEDRSEAFVEDYFTPSERTLIEEGGAEMQGLMANGLWSAKESVLKLLGLGLNVDTRSLTVRSFPLVSRGGWQPFLVHHHPDDREFTVWWRREHDWLLTVTSDPERHCPVDR